MTKAIFQMLLILAVSVFALTQSPTSVPNKGTGTLSITGQVDKLFEKWDKPDSAGCALGIVKDGKLIYEHGYGIADLEHNAHITPKTAFDIGSISKQFTGMAILLLVKEGKISLEDDVRKYVPEMPDFGVKITLQQLLYHTSGLHNTFLLRQLSGWRWGDLETRGDALSMLSRQTELNFIPGEVHSYSNTGYFVLGEVVRRVSGLSLREFESKNIFGPLGMNDTQIHDDVALIIKNRAWGYGIDSVNGWSNNITRSEEVGDSNIYTSVEDMARWDQNFYDGKVGGETVIKQMVTPGTLNNGKKISYSGAGYAAGLRIGEYKGLNLVWHAGASTSNSEYLRFPDQHFSVICFCNSGAIDPSELARQVADIYLGDLFKPKVKVAPPSAEDQAKGMAEVSAFIKDHATSVPEGDLARLAGFYANPDNGNARHVFMKDGRLMIDRGRGAESELAPIGQNRFLISGIPIKYELSFSDQWGDTRLMALSTGEGTPLILVYVGPDGGLPTKMDEFEGRFQSEQVGEAVTMLVRNGKLVLAANHFEEPSPSIDHGPGRGWYPLQAISASAFKNDWIGLLRFTRDPNGKIDGFVINNFAGGDRHLRFSKIRS